jgi:predicted ester cyclase
MKIYLFATVLLVSLSARAADEPILIAPAPTMATPATAYASGRAVVEAFYATLLSNTGDDAGLADRAAGIVGKNWVADPVSAGGPGLTGLVRTFTAYHQAIPDMKWTPQEILKVGPNRYVVRSVGTGTPVVDFLGIGDNFRQGNSFNIMTIDIHTLRKGKIVKTYHVEDWAEAMAQLSKAPE